jgi:hypothetical protein
MNNTPQLKEVVKNNTVTFSHYRSGFLYYTVSVNKITYLFPVPISDTGEATFSNTEKAMLMMRYIRKAMKDGSFVIHSVKE